MGDFQKEKRGYSKRKIEPYEKNNFRPPGSCPLSALVRVRNKIKRPDVAPRIGTNIMMVMREGIANAMRASRRQEKQKLRLFLYKFLSSDLLIKSGPYNV